MLNGELKLFKSRNFNKKYYFLGVVIIFAFQNSDALSLKVSPEDLVETSNLAVVGVVVAENSLYKNVMHDNGERGIYEAEYIFTEYTIKIQDLLLGKYEEPNIIVTVLGGVVGNTRLRATSSFSLNMEEQVLLFLRYNELNQYYHPTYGSKGAFEVIRKKENAILVQKDAYRSATDDVVFSETEGYRKLTLESMLNVIESNK